MPSTNRRMRATDAYTIGAVGMWVWLRISPVFLADGMGFSRKFRYQVYTGSAISVYFPARAQIFSGDTFSPSSER